MKTIIGIDNGVTGTIGVISDDEYDLFETPVKKIKYYTKKEKYIHILDSNELIIKLLPYSYNSFVLLERPMINPSRFFNSMSAIMCFYETVRTLEEMGLGYSVIDSKEWQHVILKGIKGRENLKKESMLFCKVNFPNVKLKNKQDADGLLIASYGRIITQ